MIRPGEVHMADFAEAGPHSVIVLSREELNRGRYALVVVCTSARFAVRSETTSVSELLTHVSRLVAASKDSPNLRWTGGVHD
jgi:mRNA-degrading endonuclease toxin of MazEF toxin-antitoxin module